MLPQCHNPLRFLAGNPYPTDKETGPLPCPLARSHAPAFSLRWCTLHAAAFGPRFPMPRASARGAVIKGECREPVRLWRRTAPLPGVTGGVPLFCCTYLGGWVGATTPMLPRPRRRRPTCPTLPHERLRDSSRRPYIKLSVGWASLPAGTTNRPTDSPPVISPV